ncbi:hypothetical protein AUJ68_07040 [Candidatus Woesearchaeota archaeon CG1_02_57_44]|nr:MAG: hypothetical protein AUJ68_07040 [Candidatus Woesearchaeota archaeon CG1_02_57_44]
MIEVSNQYWFVRHGGSKANVRHLWAGQADWQLTAKGMQQARDLYLSGVLPSLDVIVSSPLSRAVQTCLLAIGRAVPAVEGGLPLLLGRGGSERRQSAWSAIRMCCSTHGSWSATTAWLWLFGWLAMVVRMVGYGCLNLQSKGPFAPVVFY